MIRLTAGVSGFGGCGCSGGGGYCCFGGCWLYGAGYLYPPPPPPPHGWAAGKA